MGYKPFRALRNVIKANKKEPCSRRDLVIGVTEALSSLLIAGTLTYSAGQSVNRGITLLRERALVSSFLEEGVTSPERVKEIADYITDNITPVTEFRYNGRSLVYYLPDIHFTSFHRIHYNRIMELNRIFGVKLVGLEGEIGIITEETLSKKLKSTKELQRIGKYNQLEENEAGAEKREPQKIETIDDLLRVNPLLMLAKSNSGVVPVGLENSETSEQLSKLEVLKDGYSHYFEIVHRMEEKTQKETQTLQKTKDMQKNFEDEIRFDELYIHNSERLNYRPEELAKRKAGLEIKKKELPQLRELLAKIQEEYKKTRDKHQKQLSALRKELDESKKGLDPKYKLPDYDDGIKEKIWVGDTPLYQTLEKYIDGLRLDQRSSDAVRIGLEEMQKRNVRQFAIVFGQAHKEQILNELTQKGVSYIVISK